MNVNDVICVGARPVSMVDYIAIEKVGGRYSGCDLGRAVRGRAKGRHLDLGRRDRAAQGHDPRLRPRRHGDRARGARQDPGGRVSAKATPSSVSRATASTATGCRWRAAHSSSRQLTCAHRFHELACDLGASSSPDPHLRQGGAGAPRAGNIGQERSPTSLATDC